MVMPTEYAVPETKNYKCYMLSNIMYVHHYTKPGVYVGPSIRHETSFIKGRYTARTFFKEELVKLGATVVVENLWSTSARDAS